MDISIIGAGAWGTAVALSALEAGHRISLITKNQDDADLINKHHENVTFFPGISIPEEISVTASYDSLKTCDALFLICPSAAVESVCENIKLNQLNPDAPIFSFCKGLPGSTWELPSMFINKHFPDARFGVFSGPSYAKEVARGLPTKLTLGSKNNCLQDFPVSFGNMGIYYCDDVVGVELGGCLKNIFAIGAGIVDGLQLGDNAKSSYIATALQEMVDIGENLGAKKDTFFGPSGLGDLLATCTGSWSRNRTFGETITKNSNIQEIFNSSVSAIEGYRSTKTFYNILKERNIQAKLVNVIYDILYGDALTVQQLKDKLLSEIFIAK